MSPSHDDFARSLVDAGKAERAPSQAVERALRVRGPAATPATAASTPAIPGPWVIAGVVSLAAAAGAMLVVRGGTDAAGAGSSAPLAASAPAAQPAAGSPSPVQAAPATAATPTGGSRPGSRLAGEEATTCRNAPVADAPPTVCSRPGRKEQLQMVNTCADTVDVFWVDFQCRETFAGRVEPGQTFDQQTYDTHPWRVRDHASHRLIKEWIGPEQPDAPAAPEELGDVVVDDGASVPEHAPALCSRNGNHANLRFLNRRTSGVSIVFWVDFDCHEVLYARLEPGQSTTAHTFDTHPWRVRDENGALLVDYAPPGEDTTVYVSLP